MCTVGRHKLVHCTTMTSFSDTWADVEPVSQDDGPNPVVSIMYDPDYSRKMDIFRAVLRSGEKSMRVIELTAELVDMNAANYTVWKYRRDCLRSLQVDLSTELDYMDKFMEENPKNYQIWYHRRAIVELSAQTDRELPYCNSVLSVDPKNYHAWGHRQWVVGKFGLFDGELEFTSQLIESDVCNNSAWNYRWFIIHKQTTETPSSEVLEREVAFCFSKIDLLPDNESTWNYLRGLNRNHPSLKSMIQENVLNLKASISEKTSGRNVICLFLWSLLVDMYEENQTSESLQSALILIDELEAHDKIRAKYWRQRHTLITHQLE